MQAPEEAWSEGEEAEGRPKKKAKGGAVKKAKAVKPRAASNPHAAPSINKAVVSGAVSGHQRQGFKY